MIEEFKKKTGLKGTLFNGVGSGTELLKQYGEEHLKTGYPIIYTSADSVFQIAAHEDIIPVERLYEICKIAREMLSTEEYDIGTVIARPFVGDKADNFTRTYNRLIFTNLVDFDMLYGHRNNVEGYAKALEYFDNKLPEIIEAMNEDDLLIITADHGNDPSTPSTDHDREYIPILVYGKNIKHGINLGIRDTYADISATVLDIFDYPILKYGKSFKDLII